MKHELITSRENETSYYYHFTDGEVVVVQKSVFTREEADAKADEIAARLREENK